MKSRGRCGRHGGPFFLYRDLPMTPKCLVKPLTDVELAQLELDWKMDITWAFAEQRLMATVKQLRECLRIIHECYWSENEPYKERFAELQRMAGEALRSGSTTG
jgi:hypothetical protein